MPVAIVAPCFGILSFSCLGWLARIHCDRSQSMRSPEFYCAARLILKQKGVLWTVILVWKASKAYNQENYSK